MDDQVEPPVGDLPAALRARLEREPDVVLAYLMGLQRSGGHDRPPELGLGVLLRRDPGDGSRELELHAVVGEVAGSVRADLVVLNGASPEARYRMLTEGGLLLSRDERVRARYESRTVEHYFDLDSVRQMLATGLRHRLSGGGRGSA